MYNEVLLIGRVGQDAKTYNEGTDREVVNVSVATSKKWKDRSGEWKENTEWHSAVGFGIQAKSLKNLQKGELVVVKGELTYSEKDGTKYANVRVISAKRLSKPQQERLEQAHGQPTDLGGGDDLPF